MSSPKLVVQILISTTRILGKAFLEAGRQAVKNAKHAPQGALGNDVAGVGNANTASRTDQLTRQHRMTLDEAHLILNVKHGEEMLKILESYEHLFKVNSAPPKPAPGKQPSIISHSHYIQSKVVRARERIEAEVLEAKAEAPGKPEASASEAKPPPPEAPPS
ncbi:Pam16-domain-containing protein [Mycena belliarum]|uniref:Mitochondrial import inner membrane translocase subunit TIM16 n=1 Tax=Mycena belliarum TaxID=1033014 RepID=A0AAD6XK57_9AGAR|nr:Pam16-domain-containing protein [Mycena belliae]